MYTSPLPPHVTYQIRMPNPNFLESKTGPAVDYFFIGLNFPLKVGNI